MYMKTVGPTTYIHTSFNLKSWLKLTIYHDFVLSSHDHFDNQWSETSNFIVIRYDRFENLSGHIQIFWSEARRHDAGGGRDKQLGLSQEEFQYKTKILWNILLVNCFYMFEYKHDYYSVLLYITNAAADVFSSDWEEFPIW